MITKEEGDYRLQLRQQDGARHDYMFFFEFESAQWWFVPCIIKSVTDIVISIDATNSMSKTRLINHSRLAPNSVMRAQNVAGEFRLHLVAISDIKIGEEIKFD